MRKNRLLIILIIAAATYACNNNELSAEDINVDDQYACALLIDIGGIKYLNGNRFSGSCQLLQSDIDDSAEDIKIETQSYVNGVGNGVFVGYYYPEGNIAYIGYRKDGEINGKFNRFYKNGQRSLVGKFRYGLYQGKFNYYDASGKLNTSEWYDKYGVLTKAKEYE